MAVADPGLVIGRGMEGVRGGCTFPTARGGLGRDPPSPHQKFFFFARHASVNSFCSEQRRKMVGPLGETMAPWPPGSATDTWRVNLVP